MAEVENKSYGFNSIPRKLVNDSTLSDRARFLYVYMACKPPKWEFYQDSMAKELNYGKDTLRKYLDELIKAGWITEEKQQHDENGKFGSLKYTIEIEKRRKGNYPIRENTVSEKTRNGKNHNQKDIYNISSIQSISDNRDIEENNKRLSNDNPKDSSLFDIFWKKYKKGSKKAAIKAWNKLTDKKRQEAIDNVDSYLLYCKRSDRPLKDVSTYLNGECFNDDWDQVPDIYQLNESDDERIRGFKNYIVDKFPDLIYHRNPLTFEQCDKLLNDYGVSQFEWAMRKLSARDIHQYYSINQGVETILKEEPDDDI